jgi:hypothetical protein
MWTCELKGVGCDRHDGMAKCLSRASDKLGRRMEDERWSLFIHLEIVSPEEHATKSPPPCQSKVAFQPPKSLRSIWQSKHVANEAGVEAEIR